MSTIATLDDYIDDIAGTNTSSYTDAKKHRAMTRWAHIITEEVLDARKDWDYQGEIITHNLVANQREYPFPTDLLKIKRVDLKLDGTNWKPTTWVDESEISGSIASESDVTEKFNNSNPSVSILENSIFIWSGTITAVTAGFKLWYNKEIVGEGDITAFTDGTHVPTLKEFAQMALVYGAILDFAEGYEVTELATRMNMKLYGNPNGRPIVSVGGLIGRIRNFYSTRAPDKKMIIKTSSGLEKYK